MSDPIIDPSDLGIYLTDPNIDEDRAAMFIADAQTLCESVVSPLPTGAEVVVKRVAGRAYVTITSPRQNQLSAAGSPFGAAGGTGGVYLTRYDEQDLRRLQGSAGGGNGGAFSISVLPSGYVAPGSWIADVGGDVGGFL